MFFFLGTVTKRIATSTTPKPFLKSVCFFRFLPSALVRFSKTNDEGVGLLGIYAVAWLRKRVGMDRRDDVAVGKVEPCIP